MSGQILTGPALPLGRGGPVPETAAPAFPDALLDRVRGPADLRGLTAAELRGLAAEIRELLVEVVTRVGGHLGPNLGVVELTIALHRVFDSPRDAIVFDAGHQGYVHKLLTGRRAEFALLRQAGGQSGYPSRAESPHDLVENSHASTALSYADGLTRAFAGKRGKRHVVAVVGDGALTGGMCWEALNNIAVSGRPVVVVLNDNGRSYAPTAGAVGSHLAHLREDAGGYHLSVFESLGMSYVGPVDGHDVGALEAALGKARALGRPVVVHCVTTKGKGHPPAERDEADRLHTVPPANAERPAGPTWTSVFAREVVELGRRRPDIACLSAAMLRPTGLQAFAEEFPERTHDVGVAEQHAVTSAAGLAMGGLHPVVAVCSTFLTRALDQVLMDVALHALPVTFVLDRAGVTGDDGPSHHGVWDLSLLQAVPGLRIAAPRDGEQLRALLGEAVRVDGPTALRFPRGETGPAVPRLRAEGGVDVLYESGRRDVALVTVGPMALPGVRAALRLGERGTGVTVCDPRWVSPPSPALVDLVARHRVVVCVEDGVRVGGVGARLAQAVRDAGHDTPVHALGLPAEFLPQGPRADILRRHRLDAVGLAKTITALVEGDHSRGADPAAEAEVPHPRGRGGDARPRSGR
ncbi:1-deoxy-D-xylulose-5-phosphate synthase [Actinokineospora spheciospongiae]|uniref:1-deoxy-D-xylulose-5-phosphate synthase n=1 Tax=Actinokineospora spheciospongiae TaxID=909613 RepID=UPI000D7133BA|nr:1-deoxy-D-xylulose-5-phosphate synthase [Actinokineospora spheciospongiae]PWW53069.1 1-deoxy-D-xylulose-5-phosphate synthase [Actinokineospora spheciospongiae]